MAKKMLNACGLVIYFRTVFGHAFCHVAAVQTRIWFEELRQRPNGIRPAGDIGHLRDSFSSRGFQLPATLTTNLTHLSEWTTPNAKNPIRSRA